MAGLFDGTPLQRPVTCESCGQTVESCACPRDASGVVCWPNDQEARVRREKRRGNWVTVVTGLDPKATDLKALLKGLKTRCASGGAVLSDGVEVQGDHRDRLVKILQERGYPAKASGG